MLAHFASCRVFETGWNSGCLASMLLTSGLLASPVAICCLRAAGALLLLLACCAFGTPRLRLAHPLPLQRPITVNFGMSMPGWYDIASLEDINAREDKEGLHESQR